MQKIRIHKNNGEFYDIPQTGLANQLKYNRKLIARHELLKEPNKEPKHVFDTMTVADLKLEAEKMELPKQKWQNMTKVNLVKYLKEQSK